MLSSISWSTYWMCIACLLPLYYLYVGIAYFREEIAGLLKGGLAAKKKKNPSSIPSSNKEGILGSYGTLDTQEEQEEEIEEEEDDNDKANWQPVPASNAQYAAAGIIGEKREESPLQATGAVAVIQADPVKEAAPAIVPTPVKEPFSDIPLEENNEHEGIISSIPLKEMPAKIIDVDMFFAFMELNTSKEHTQSSSQQMERQEIEVNVDNYEQLQQEINNQKQEEESVDKTFNSPVF